MSKIVSTSVLIDVLGGNKRVAELTGSSPSAVSGWRKSKLPAATYVVLNSKIAKMGLSVSPDLWSMRPRPRTRR